MTSLMSRIRFVTLATAGFLVACGGGGDAGGGGTNPPPSPAAVASVALNPTTASIAPGASVTITATPRDASGNALSGRTVSWSSSSTSVATVSSSGVVTGVAAGSATITATSEGQSANAAITVTGIPVASVSLTAQAPGLNAGTTDTLTAIPKDANGNTLSGRTVTWSTSNASIATVNSNGVVSGVAPGSVNITATSEGKSASVTLTVYSSAPVATVVVTPNALTLHVGEKGTLTVTLKDAQGNTLGYRFISASNSNPSVASVVNGDPVTVTGVAQGTATLTYTSEGKSGSATITVVP
jgi:uncharacterized protein YjdB